MADVAECSIISRPGLIALGEELPSKSSISQLCSTECVTQITSAQLHSAVVCASGRVYTFGINDYQVWMKKHTTNEPTLVTPLSSVKITQAACGGGSTFFLTEKGELYTAGCSGEGQLGLGNTIESPTPVLVRGLPPVRKAAAGWGHVVVLTDNGEVWACGNNACGQLGLGHVNNVNTFARVPDLPEPIIDVSCGDNFTALLTASHHLMMAGKNDDIQPGVSRVGCSPRFLSISLPTAVIADVACGSCHTVALAMNGSVWAWGRNDRGQLGIGKTCERNSPPQRVVGLKGYTISRVFAGEYHTALLTHRGDVFVCGRGKSGELGQSWPIISVPTKLRKSPGLMVQQIAFGYYFSLLMVTMQTINPPPEIKQDNLGTRNSDQVSSCFTDLEKTIMKSLECPVCFNVMCAPIHLCCNGHSLCGSCYSSMNTNNCPTCRGQFIPSRNISLENVSAEVQLPCVDCLLRMPVAFLEAHASVCPRRQYSCPLQQTCGWSGRPEAMLAHASSAHPQQTWQDLPHTFSHSMSVRPLHTVLLAAHNEMFTLHGKSTTNEAQFAVRYIGLPENAAKFRFRMEFNVNDEHLCFVLGKKVCSDVEVDEELFKPRYCVRLRDDEFESPCETFSCKVNILRKDHVT